MANNYNGKASGGEIKPCSEVDASITSPDQSHCFYRGVGASNSAGTSHESDSYSVLASFGSKTSGKDGVSIAQYFATGLAARILASNGAALVNAAVTENAPKPGDTSSPTPSSSPKPEASSKPGGTSSPVPSPTPKPGASSKPVASPTPGGTSN
ncbi:MAG: hypothetical protein HQK89_00950 [Nitrospirae bacterium]|nr:hypothetical protein [Nitrospirota bacterium]